MKDLEAERALLGAMLLNAAAYDAAAPLSERDFSAARNAQVFAAIRTLVESGKPVDVLTVWEQLKADGAKGKVSAYVAELSADVACSANAAAYADIVRGLALRRRLAEVAGTIERDAKDMTVEVAELAQSAEQAVYDATDTRKREGATRTVGAALREGYKLVERAYRNQGELCGLPTPWSRLNGLTLGLQSGDLIVLAARPSMGKTSMAMNIAAHAAIHNKIPVAVFSLEMSAEQIALRMLASEARVDFQNMRKGNIAESGWPKMAVHSAKIAEAPIYIDDTGACTIGNIRSESRRLKRAHDIGLIVVDYLQLMSGVGENRTQEVAGISRGLKLLAGELSVPVLVMSQLNRSLEQRGNKRPMLSDLRESGAIEQDADVVMFVYREEMYLRESQITSDLRGAAELIIAKQRNGPTGTIDLDFNSRFVLFSES